MKRHMLYFSGVLLFLLGLLVMLQASDLNPLLISEYYTDRIFSHMYFFRGPEVKYDLLLIFLYLGIGTTICILAIKIMEKQTKFVS